MTLRENNKDINSASKSRGCTIFQTWVIFQQVSLKIIVFSMETTSGSPSEELQHGGRKPVETFLLSLKLENIRTSLNILATQNSKT